MSNTLKYHAGLVHQKLFFSEAYAFLAVMLHCLFMMHFWNASIDYWIRFVRDLFFSVLFLSPAQILSIACWFCTQRLGTPEKQQCDFAQKQYFMCI